MRIRNIIDLLESQGEWMNRSCTRDRILFGDDETEISKVITCWVATNKVIHYAIEHDIHFIISHENPFYLASTTLPTLICYEMTIVKWKYHNSLIFVLSFIFCCYFNQGHRTRNFYTDLSAVGHSVIRGLVTSGQWFRRKFLCL